MNRYIAYPMVALAILFTTLAADKVKVSDVESQYSTLSKIDADKELKQSINLGFSNTTGNTDTLNLNGKYSMSLATQGYGGESLKIAFDASAFVTENNDVKENEEFTANLGLEQHIVDDLFGYASMNWLRNQFRNFDSKLSMGAGVGKEVFNDGQHTLKVKFGVAHNIELYTNDQEKQSFTSFNEYLEYNNKLNAVSDLYIKLGALQHLNDLGDYEVLAVAGFNFSVAEDLSVSIEEEVRYDKIPPVGFDTTDTKTIVRVGYNF